MRHESPRAVKGRLRGAAERMPWDRDSARLYRTIFPQMALWLPEGEAVQLRLDFEAEMARLDAA